MRTIRKDEVIAMLKRAAEKRTQRGLAREAGLSASYVNDVLQGRRDPTEPILDVVGVERATVYRRKAAKSKSQ